MSENCPNAYRKKGDVSLHCRALEGQRFTQCAHQYLCPRTRRWEATPDARKCKLRKKV